MDDYYYKRSGQIPAFGDWDYANELPITQYFECARQAGLIRFSSSSGEAAPDHDLYAALTLDHHLNNNNSASPTGKAIRGRGRGRGRGGGREKRAHVMEQKKQAAKVCDVTQPPPNKHHHHKPQPNRTHSDKDKDGTVLRPHRFPTRPPKPVDEDLYKIPPELLHTTKRKKMLGLFSCLVPACAS